MTAENIADVDLGCCTDDYISYKEEQKHESCKDVAVSAIGLSTPAEQKFRRRGYQ